MRHRLLITRLTIAGLILGALLGMAVLASLVAPYDPIQQDLNFSLFSPNHFHPFGTDRFGRDVLARVAYGARASLAVGTLATLLATTLGVGMGMAAGSSSGLLGVALARFVDLMLAFPTLIMVLVLASFCRANNWLALVALMGCTTWMSTARLVRAETLSVSSRRFIEAAQGLGASPARRIMRHILPNVISTALIAATLQVGDMMLMESGLSYLGLGIAPPTPSWGDMVRHGMQSLGDAWWVATFPGLALALAVVGFNLLGDGLRDALDPRLAATDWRGGVPPATS